MEDGKIVGQSHEGDWWLPGSPETKVAGRLVVSDTGRSSLHLIGALGTDGRRFRNPEEGALTVIHGRVGARRYTLDRCFQTGLSGDLVGGRMRQTIHVNRVLAGAAWFEELLLPKRREGVGRCR